MLFSLYLDRAGLKTAFQWFFAFAPFPTGTLRAIYNPSRAYLKEPKINIQKINLNIILRLDLIK